MTIEDKLKELILSRYNSIREFAIDIDIPYTTIASIFKRGIANSSVSNIIKICKALNISADALADGEIKPNSERSAIMLNDIIEINNLPGDTRKVLTHGNSVTIDGKPIDKVQIDYIVNGLEIIIETAKRKK